MDIENKDIPGTIKFEKQVDEKKVKKEYQTKLPIETKYSQHWAKYNLAKTSEKRLFYELLNELCKLIPEPPYEFGRPAVPIKDLVFISALKLYNNFSSRKIAWDIKQAEMAGYIKRSVHFNRLSDFMNAIGTYDLLKRLLTITALPLKHLEDAYSIDSSGFGSYQYERWMQAKFKNKRGWRNYVKGHITIGTRTNIICSAEVTYGNESDVTQAPKILASLKHFKPKQVSGDKAYSSYKILQIVENLGANPFIAFRENTNPRPNAPEIWKRVYHHFLTKKEDFYKQYHKRSNVETTFAMVKMRLGEFLRSKNHEAQKNEVLMKFIVHNITCIVQEVFENNVNVDFKESIRQLSES